MINTKRWINQLVMTPANRWAANTVVALCDDGSAWRLEDHGFQGGGRWQQLPPIPQHDLNGPEMLIAEASCQESNPEER